MYAEKSTTGNNLIDLTDRETLIIRDSLNGAVHMCHRLLCLEEKEIIGRLINKISPLCPPQANRQRE